MSRSSSGFTIGPMGIIIFLIIFNWVAQDEETGNNNIDEVRTEVNEIVGNVIDEVKDGVQTVKDKANERDSIKTYDASNDFQESQFSEDIEWAELD